MLNFLLGRGGSDRLDAAEAVARVGKGELVLIDVRDRAELGQTGKATGALHIPMATMRMRTDPRSPDFEATLATDKPVAVYCASGARSQMAVQVLRKNGFEEVYNIGGFNGWVSAGGAVERA